MEEFFGDGSKIDPSRASAVFFSTRGSQPLADMLAGGDYDGDTYYVMQERDLLELCGGEAGVGVAAGGAGASSSAASQHSAPLPCPSGAALEEALRHHFLSVRHDASAAVGHAAVEHQAAADRFGLRHPTTAKLGEIYLDLLDGRGDLQRHSARIKELRQQIGPRPVWMKAQRGGNPSRYTAKSSSALARLDECALGELRLALHGGRLRLDPLLRLDLHGLDDAVVKQMKSKWDKLHKEYRSQYRALKRQQQQEEEERARREGGRVDSTDGSDATDRDNEWKDRFFDLVASMRERYLLAKYAAEREQQPLAEPPHLIAEACALYEVVMANAIHATHEQEDPTYYTSFVWHMAGDLLIFVRKARLSRQADPSRALFTSIG